jgi:hypothetical protein
MTKSEVIAIDILLEPDARMLTHAKADNARLRGVFPESFALDAAHRPHITLLQCFVATKSLDALCAAAGDLFRNARPRTLELRAIRYDYTPGPGMGVANICATPTPALQKLQADVIAAATPFLAPTGAIDAFTAGHDNAAYDTALIDYVTGFAAKHAGENFDPHVSTGVAPIEYLKRMIAEPFPEFTFAPAGGAVYQLGPFGTAARMLQRWDMPA